MHTITIYTLPGCGPCFATKRAFAAQGQIHFEEVNLETAPEELEEFRTQGHLQAPVVVIETDNGTQCWSGYRLDKIKAVKDL